MSRILMGAVVGLVAGFVTLGFAAWAWQAYCLAEGDAAAARGDCVGWLEATAAGWGSTTGRAALRCAADGTRVHG